MGSRIEGRPSAVVEVGEWQEMGVVDKAGIGRHRLTCSGSANLYKTAKSEPGHMRSNN